MQHRGFDIKAVQGINGGKWKWTVQLTAQRRQGEARNRDLAIFAAKKAIDGALDPKPPKKVRMQPR
jgi:hypothetical protein